MKNKILIVAISFILIATTAFAFAFTAPTKAAVASAGNLANISFKVYCENINHILNDAQPIMANKQIGIYFENYPAYCKVILKGTDGSQIQKSIVNNKVEIPIKNNVTIRAYLLLNSPILPELDIGISITYDTERPNISSTTLRAEVKNGETVIGKTVTVKANDNFGNLKLYMSKNDAAETLCEGPTFTITDDGKYTFYAVDIANNYSDDFTITYFQQPPEEKPDDTENPSRPSKPSRPTKPTTPDDSDPAVIEDEATAVRLIIVIALVIAIVIIGIVIYVVVYKKAKAKAAATQFDDE